jgi:SAM-dependent methyltransferase
MTQYATDYIQYTWQMLNGFRAGIEEWVAGTRERDLAPYLSLRQPRRILDLANGRLRPQYALLRSAGHTVYGIDLANRPQATWVDASYTIARRLYGFKLALPSAALARDRLVCGNVGVLPFPDSSFDLVTSVAAFEHFLDVPAVLGEIRRVLRPGGMAWIWVHMFTSPSGGHNLSFAQLPLRTLPAGVQAWDHLRQRRLPFHVPLNEWRKHQYAAEFRRHFELLKDYCAAREGEHLLTPELEAELSDYSRDELTCWGYVLVARKPAI